MPFAALSSLVALIAAVLPSPLSATLTPNQSFGPVLDALRNACSDQVPPLRTYTYAAPIETSSFQSLSQPFAFTPVALQSSSSDPTSSVVPSSLSATWTPKESCDSLFDALM